MTIKHTIFFPGHSYQKKYQKILSTRNKCYRLSHESKGVSEQELNVNNCELVMKDTWKLFAMRALSYKRRDNKT